MHKSLLHEIHDFLAATGMGPSYFGVRACGNSKLVKRLAEGKRVWPHTELAVRQFMAAERKDRVSKSERAA